MSQLLLWGTGISDTATAPRITEDGDVRITEDENVRVVDTDPVRVIFVRDTSAGDTRVTSEGDRRITIDGLLGPEYFETANVSTDGGEQFDFSWTSNPWQPTAQGGEQVFRWAYISVAWSMSATLRITPTVDGDPGFVSLGPTAFIENVVSMFQLDQQSGNLQRLARVFPIPLVRRVVVDGVEQFRSCLRGERLQLTVESTGPLGVGELMLDGCQVEYTPVRKAIYPTVNSTP